jgi:hypothetical protein
MYESTLLKALTAIGDRCCGAAGAGRIDKSGMTLELKTKSPNMLFVIDLSYRGG